MNRAQRTSMTNTLIAEKRGATTLYGINWKVIDIITRVIAINARSRIKITGAKAAHSLRDAGFSVRGKCNMGTIDIVNNRRNQIGNTHRTNSPFKVIKKGCMIHVNTRKRRSGDESTLTTIYTAKADAP